MDPFIDPAMAEWLRQKKEALGGAIAADKASQQDEDRRALLMQYAQGYANKRPVAVPARQVDDAQRQFQAETGLEQGARDDSLAAYKAFASTQGKDKPQDPDDLPPPPEWGAPASIATRKEARSLGWGPKPEKPEEPLDPMKAPPSAQLRAALEKAGQDPTIYPTTAAALSALNARSQVPYIFKVDSAGNLQAIPTRGTDLTPRAVPGSGGEGNFRPDKDLSGSERARLADIAGDVKHIEALGSEFKDEYAGKGPLGGAQVWAAQKAGSAGTEGMQKLGEFWSRYERMINIPERHEKFGSALTPQEKQSWDAARNIRPGVDPKVARRAFAEVAGITRAVMQRIGDALVADGYSAEAVREATGGLYKAKGAAPAGGATAAVDGDPLGIR